MRRTKAVFAATAVLVLALLLACAPGAPAGTPPPKEKTVKVGVIAVLTGPIASTGAPIFSGILDYLRYVNEKGGIEYTTPEGKADRVKLDIKWQDSAYDMARSVAIYKRLEEWGAQIMHTAAGSIVLTNLASIMRDHMPGVYYTVAQPNAMAEKPVYMVAENLTYTDEMAVFMDWVKANWKEARPPRVGFIQLDTAMARAELPGKVAEYAKKIGVEFLGMEWLPYAVTESTVELKRLAEKGADWIFIAHVAGGISVVLKDAVRLGLKDKIKFAIVSYGFDETALRAAGEAMEGVYGVLVSALTTEDLPGVREAKDLAARYRPGFEMTIGYMRGVVQAKVMVEGIKLALEKVGYENLSRDAIREGLVSIKDFDVGGVIPNVTIDPEYPVFNPYYRFAVVEGGRFKAISDWLKGHYLLKGWKPGG